MYSPRVRSRVHRILSLLIVIMCAPVGHAAQTPSSGSAPIAIVPAPMRVERTSGVFTLMPTTTIVVPQGDERANWIGRYLSGLIGLAVGTDPLKVESGQTPASAIQLVIGNAENAGDEGYELTVTPERV